MLLELYAGPHAGEFQQTMFELEREMRSIWGTLQGPQGV